MQPPVGTPGEEVTLYVVEAGEDGRDLVDGEQVGIGRERHWLGEPIMEEVEAVADEGREQCPSRSWRRKRWRSRDRKGPETRVRGWC